MKSLKKHISESLRIGINKCIPVMNESLRIGINDKPEILQPKSWDELRQIIEKRFKEFGPGTEQEPINFNDIDISEIPTFYNESPNYGLFENTNFHYIDVAGWDVSHIKSMKSMFSYVPLQKIDLSTWNTSSVIDMGYMFVNCPLAEANLSNFDTSKVEDMSCMFFECTQLNKLDLSNFDLHHVKRLANMFYKCKSLNELIISDKFEPSKRAKTLGMFDYVPDWVIPEWYEEE